MGDLSHNFNLSEFRCKCCGEGIPKKKLINVLENIRFVLSDRYYPNPVKITISGPLRCESHNKEVGGVSNSRHLFKHSDGVDIKAFSKVEDKWLQILPEEVVAIAELLLQDTGGIGQYKGRTHIDVRSKKARWDFR